MRTSDCLEGLIDNPYPSISGGYVPYEVPSIPTIVDLENFMKVRPIVDRAKLAELVRTLPASSQTLWVDRLDLGDVVTVKPAPRIYFAIGVARCGKSTWGKWWVEGLYTPEVEGPRVRWNSDDLRLEHTGERFNRHVEPFIHTVKSLAIGTLVRSGHTVFVDGTHTTEESIKDLLKIDINAEPILFADVAKETCIERAYATGQDDLIPVIDRQYKQMNALLADGVDALMARLRDQVKSHVQYRWGKNVDRD